jgi:hypothetical protein
MSIDISEADVKAAEPNVLVKLAAAAQALTGLFVGLCGLQMVGLRFGEPMLRALPYVLMVGGVLQIVLASRVYRARVWAAFSAATLGGLLALVLVSWFFYSFGALFSCMVMLAVPLSLLSAVFSAVALGPVRKAAAARERLDSQGISLGL